MRVRTFSNKRDFIQKSVDFIAKACAGKDKTFRIALSGGSTPEPVYKALVSNKKMPFKKIEFYEVDERYVPKNHKDSNQKMMRAALKKSLKNLKEFHVFDTSLPISKCLKKYEEILKKIPGGSFDLTILGIGPDGHTASLFPHSPALKEKKRLTAHTTTRQFAVKDRLTLTFPPILKSKKILVLLKGKEKEKVLQKLKDSAKKNPYTFPAKTLVKHKGLTVHFLKNV